jgi:hypothetical protein
LALPAALSLVLLTPAAQAAGEGPETAANPAAAATIRRIYDEALTSRAAYQNLTELVSRYPGRLSGSQHLAGAIGWATAALRQLPLDQVTTQPVMVPHWERGEAEAVSLAGPGGPVPLAAAALGGTIATPAGGVTAEVVTVHTEAELNQLGTAGLRGKIVFIDRPMNPRTVNTATSYGEAGWSRNRGPGLAAKYGAVAALTRSLTLAQDDTPHTGNTSFAPGQPKLPAAALSWVSADRLAQAVAANPHTQVTVALHGHWLPDAPAANVIGEIRGSEHPEQVILVGGHLDSWDIAPGANDDGSGVVQSIEVLRLFRAAGIRPKHTIRCVLFVNEENGGRGGQAYAAQVRKSGEKHLLALETDNGSFQPRGFTLANVNHDVAQKASRWLPLLAPYGIAFFADGSGGSDVQPLAPLGIPVGELRPDSQLYFDYHHTRNDTLEHVNPRELALGAAALAAVAWLTDEQGL